MGFAGLATIEDEAVTVRKRRGRRRSSTIQAERDKHVQAAVLLYVKRLNVSIVMVVMGCSRSAAYLWADRALNYPEYAAACREALCG
jgi:hypothetical protein